MMEISQMQYFVEIVQSDCNLTVAAVEFICFSVSVESVY